MHSTFTSLINSHVIILCREVRERPGQTAQFPTNLSREPAARPGILQTVSPRDLHLLLG